MTRDGTGAPVARIGPGGAVRIATRSVAILGWLLLCLAGYALASALRRRNPWARRFLGGVARLVGMRISVRGPVPQGRAFLIANHVSWMDILALAHVSGTAFVAHDGLAQIGWLKRLCELNGTIFIARSRRGTVRDQIGQIRDALDKRPILTIFPEGTTSDGVEILPFKSALLSALTPIPPGVAVHPVRLYYGRDARAIAWVGEEPGLRNYLRVAARREPVPLTVDFRPALTPAELADRKTIAAAAFAAIARPEPPFDQRVAL